MLAIHYRDGVGVPISFLLGSDEVAHVTSLILSLRFQLSDDFMFIDQEVYDANSGDLTHTIGQSPVCNGSSKHWLLDGGRYQVYGISNSVMIASTELVTPHQSSTGIVQLTPTTEVKLEPADELITILSDDSEDNSPTVVLPMNSPLVNTLLVESSQKSPSPLSQAPHVVCPTSSCIFDSLKRIWAIKGVRNVSKTLDFDTLVI